MSDPLMKTASVLGRIKGQAAILIIEKTAFGDNVSSITTEKEAPTLKLLQHNDIYRWYLASLSQESMSIKATIIYPATEVHIRKHQKQKRHMIKETPEIYQDHIEGYIQTMKGSRIQWYCIFARLRLMCRVYNVLEHKAESEKIIYEDPDPENGFILSPDL
jgi:m7GpppX diphosphatase